MNGNHGCPAVAAPARPPPSVAGLGQRASPDGRRQAAQVRRAGPAVLAGPAGCGVDGGDRGGGHGRLLVIGGCERRRARGDLGPAPRTRGSRLTVRIVLDASLESAWRSPGDPARRRRDRARHRRPLGAPAQVRAATTGAPPACSRRPGRRWPAPPPHRRLWPAARGAGPPRHHAAPSPRGEAGRDQAHRHSTAAMARPAPAAPRPTTAVAATLRSAWSRAPASARRTVSKVKVENVV